MQGAITLDQTVDSWIVQRAHDDCKGVTLQGVGESGEFPCAEVGGEEKNTLPPGIGALEVFEAFVHDDLADIFPRVARKETDFGELASEGNVRAPENAAALSAVHSREREGEVAHADAPEASEEQVDDQTENDAFGAS